MKQLSDDEYFQKIIKREHYPTIIDVGSQRDPENKIVCHCHRETLKYPYADAPHYTDHLFDIIRTEFFPNYRINTEAHKTTNPYARGGTFDRT